MPLVVSVIGARPQFVKASVVCRALDRRGIEHQVIHTGQHYDSAMSERFFAELQVPTPIVDLGVGSGPHGLQTARMLERLEARLMDLPGATVLTYGDTNSALAAALVAAKLKMTLGHIEAGLRSFNRAMPEEVNRVVADHLSDLLFAPTSQAVTNLKLEGLQGRAVYLTGDVMLDAAILFTPLAERESTIRDRLNLDAAGYVLATIHRPENTQDPDRLRAVIEGLKAVATKIRVILPAHPRTRAAIVRDGISTDGIVVIDPVGYLDMLALQGQAAAIATDSGGLQKEAFFQRIPCVTLRTETEWVELVDLGWNRLAPPFSSAAVSEAILSAIGTSGLSAEPYGNGDASTAIAEILSDPIAIDHPTRSESGTGSEGRWRS